MTTDKTKLGVLHPGAMGASIAATAKDNGCEVHWASAGRSTASRDRAESLLDSGTVQRLCEVCPLVISVCPPEFAGSVADEVVSAGFHGIFVDANAVAPQKKIEMAAAMEARGIRFVDAGIIGLPSRKMGETTLLLSGDKSDEVAACFTKGPIVPQVLGGEVGRASALKICFAGYNKGMIALYTALFATAEHYGVLEELRGHLVHRGLSLETIAAQMTRMSGKAWRWEPEMHEIAATLEEAGMPGDFHRAAAEIYGRLEEFKDDEVGVEQILAAVRANR